MGEGNHTLDDKARETRGRKKWVGRKGGRKWGEEETRKHDARRYLGGMNARKEEEIANEREKEYEGK